MKDEAFEELMRRAGSHESLGDVARAALGLETRVMARVRAEIEAGAGEAGTWDTACALLWRSALGLGVVVAGVFLATWFSGAWQPSDDLVFELWGGAWPLELVVGVE